MKKNYELLYFLQQKWRKIIRIMKLTAVLIFLGIITVTAGQSYSQTTRLTLEMKDVTLIDIFREIERTTEFGFFFKNEEINLEKRQSIDLKGARIEDVLEEILDDNYSYRILGRNIVVTKKNFVSHSQQVKNVSGKVMDDKGDPLPGVTVVVKGTSNGIITDTNGNYSLANVPVDATLQFSFVGLKAKEVLVGDQTIIDVVLSEEMIGLEEVVAIGYGTRKKESLTGAISNIVAKDILTTTHSSLAQNLQGKIAGLQIRQNTGEPGDFNTMINIRGFGSPLYVIDGIARDGGIEFQKLNPEDIESISVLKDASAAIYGLNAANGVIIITTKKGAKGKVKFNYNSVAGFQYPTNVPKMANAVHYLEMLNDASVSIGLNPYISEEELDKYRQGLSGYEGTDWYDETMKKASFQQQHNISAQGGNDDVSYFVSFGFLQEDGLLKTNDLNYNKYNVRSNITTNLTKNLRAIINISGRYDKKNAPGQVFEDILKGTRVSIPTGSVYANNNPEYLSIVAPTNLNPVAFANRDYTGYKEDVNKNFQSSVSLSYKVPFIQGMELKGLASYDNNNYSGKNLSKSYNLYTYDPANNFYIGNEQGKPSRISNRIVDKNRITLQAHLLYKKSIADKHNIGVTMVYEQRKGWSRTSYLEREYAFYTNDQINQASVNNQLNNGSEAESANISYLGRLTYDYKGKYLIEYAARYDGSYRYNPDKRWGFFPVISGGWRISEEKFIKDKFPFLSNLKLRGSYGLIGQDVGVPFQYVQGFSTTGGGGYEFVDGEYYSGAASPSIVNKYLTWSKSNIKDIGVNIGLFRSKIEMEFDVYQRDRTGLLAIRDVSLPNTFGGTLPEENLNSDRVRGIEFSVEHNNTIGDLHYGVKCNFNFARTMDIYVESTPFRSSWDKWKNGSSNRWSDIVWAYVLEGQFQSQEEIIFSPGQNGTSGNIKELPGDYKYKDVNGDGVINSNDMLPIFWGGNPKLYYGTTLSPDKDINGDGVVDSNDMRPIYWGGDPKLFYGLTLSAEWKNFDLFALFQGAGKYTIRFWGGGTYGEMFCFGGNIPEYFYDRWHLADQYDPNSEWIEGKWPVPRTKYEVGAMYNESSVWRNDASYLRFKSIEIGYTIEPELIKKWGLINMRIYADAHNLFTICDPRAKIFDPEKVDGVVGNTGLSYPLTKSFNIGLNIRF